MPSCRHPFLLAATTLLLLLLAASDARAASAKPLDGRTLYGRDCERCHGPEGRGDGPDAELFVRPPRNLRDGFLDAHSSSDVARTILDGPQRLDLNEAAMRANANDTEALIAYMRQLPTIDWKSVDPGEVTFVERCTPCHGAFGRPGAERPPGVRPPRDLSDPAFQRSTNSAELISAVRHGRAGMPGLTPRLSEAQAHDVAAYVRLLSPGHTIYSQYCAQCHGNRGVGVGSLGESFPVPTVVFDRAYFDRHDGDQLRVAVWHMLQQHQPAMPHFRGALSEAEAAAIVRYLREQPAERRAPQ
jgi:mono/diheme cytochrome c family protein